MERLRELLAVDHRQALEFFVLGLRDVCEPGVDREELLYNARRADLDTERTSNCRHLCTSVTSSTTLCSTRR